jgi:hypothetical protein
VALFCVAAALYFKSERYYHDVVLEDGTGRDIYQVLRLGAIIAVAGGIGAFFRNTLRCIAIAVIIYLVRCAFLPEVN